MRFTAALAVVAAMGVQAFPQDYSQSVQPITQISDGQIQAPPATSVPVSYGPPGVPSVSASVSVTTPPVATPTSGYGTGVSSVVPSVVVPSVVVPPVVVPSVVVPSVSAPPAGNTTVPVVVPSVSSNGTPSFPNTTAPSGVRPTSSGSSPTASGPPQQTGAASANMVSFGGFALAVAGFVLA